MKYFVTYKKLGIEFPDQKDYKNCLKLLRFAGEIHYEVYEYDSQGKIHLHCVWEPDKSGTPLFIKYAIPGYHHFILPIFNESQLFNYLQKQDRKYFQMNYAF